MKMTKPAPTWTGKPKHPEQRLVVGGGHGGLSVGRQPATLRLPRWRPARRLSRRAVRLRLRSQAPPSADGAEGSPRRQGRQPRRDDERAQAAGARRLHDLHRRLPRLPGRAAGRASSTPRSPSTVGALEKKMGRRLGDPADPLLVSVRSGAKFSMPGMMDTVLNLGLNDKSVKGLAAGDERRALRVRLVPAVHLDVRAHRPRRRRGAVRAPLRGGQAGRRRHQRRRPARRRPQGAVHHVQGGRQGPRPARPSRRIR